MMDVIVLVISAWWIARARKTVSCKNAAFIVVALVSVRSALCSEA
jgi:hypothetical protein